MDSHLGKLAGPAAIVVLWDRSCEVNITLGPHCVARAQGFCYKAVSGVAHDNITLPLLHVFVALGSYGEGEGGKGND